MKHKYILYILMLLIVPINTSMSAETKWDKINKNKQERRIKEQKYESCVQQCMKSCK